MNRYELRHKKLQLNIHSIGFILLAVINLLPDELFHVFRIYSSGTPSDIVYKWLNYSFGIVEGIIILYGFFLGNKHKHKWIWPAIVIFFIRELFFLMFSEYSVIAEGKYEIYLSLFVGVALIEWQLHYGTDWKEKWNNFLIIMMLNIFSIYLNVIFGRSGIAGRFNAVNLDVGATGVLAGIVFIAMLLNKKFKNKILWAGLAGIGLVLSGSRMNLLITIVLTIISVFLNTSKNLAEKKLFRFRLSTLIVIIGLVGIVAFYGTSLLKRFESSRIVKIFNSDYLDDALSGRPASLIAGWNIMKKHPLGISASFINLQYNSIREGFGTFPHFGFLVQYIFFGPLVFILLFPIIKAVIILYKRKNWQIFFPVLYLMIYNTIGGGPIVNPKIIYIFGFVFIISRLAIQENDDKCIQIQLSTENIRAQL